MCVCVCVSVCVSFEDRRVVFSSVHWRGERGQDETLPPTWHNRPVKIIIILFPISTSKNQYNSFTRFYKLRPPTSLRSTPGRFLIDILKTSRFELKIAPFQEFCNDLNKRW